MRTHILHHVPFELIGNIEPWLSARSAAVTETRFWESHSLPQPRDIDLLVIMGGPMSVNDEATHPWLIEEKAFIRNAVANDVPTLGICLGSQLLASAHGAKVARNKFAEHGWFDVTHVPAPASCFQFPERLTPFHSHGETFELPSGAVHLARSKACEHQAFQLGKRAVGIQFHLESTVESAKAIDHECGASYARGRYVQTAGELRLPPAVGIEQSADLMSRLLDYLVR